MRNLFYEFFKLLRYSLRSHALKDQICVAARTLVCYLRKSNIVDDFFYYNLSAMSMQRNGISSTVNIHKVPEETVWLEMCRMAGHFIHLGRPPYRKDCTNCSQSASSHEQFAQSFLHGRTGKKMLLYRGCNSKNARYTRWLKVLYMAGHFSHYNLTGYVYVCAADTLSASATISAAHTQTHPLNW